MSRFFGYCLSIVEEFFFLGFISAIVAMVFFHSSPMAFFSQMNNSASFSSAFFSYLFFSIFLYPLCLLLSVICQKKVGFTEKNIQIIHLPLTLFSIYIMI